jgi:transforming growth factor-beta-induced protein
VQAGLTGNLTGTQDFTLFAPTNEAFQAAQASASDLAAITTDQQLLTQILTYHVVEGVLAPLPDEAVKSLEGSDLTVNGSSEPNKVNTASVLEALPASNGVVYVINEVLIPPNFVPPTTAATTTEPPTTTTVALQNIPDTLVSLGQYSTLTSLLAATGLTPVLAGAGPFTLWAPTDAAFQALPPATVQALTANTDLLRQVLLYHVLQGAAAGADLTSRAYRTVQGEDIQVVVGDPIVVNGTSQVVQPNVLASNGVIYGINQVLIPPNVTIP